MKAQGPKSPKEKPKKFPSYPLVEGPNFGISDEEVSPRGNLDIFPCYVEHEDCPNATQDENTLYMIYNVTLLHFTLP